MNIINILIADDHKLIRETWADLLSTDPRFHVIALCGDAEDAVEKTRTLRPHIVLMDINIQPYSGFEATEKICRFAPGCRVIAVSMHSHPVYVKRMMKSGASGYVTKNSSREEMIQAIIDVSMGKKFICSDVLVSMTDQLISPEVDGPDIRSLSARELQIVSAIREGRSSGKIAAELQIALRTVETHRHNILKKLKLNNAAALVNFFSTHAEFVGA
jgi:DNA-binding NarL/FixJ family response regulator